MVSSSVDAELWWKVRWAQRAFTGNGRVPGDVPSRGLSPVTVVSAKMGVGYEVIFKSSCYLQGCWKALD